MQRLRFHSRLTCLLAFASLGFFTQARADTVVVFNEIMYHPATNETALEWVEIHNQLAVNVDISDWSIAGGIDFTFPLNTVIPGGGYLVVAIDPAALQDATGAANALGPFTGRLSNNGETLQIRNNSGRVVDEVSYETAGNWPVGPDGAGVSLAKRDRDTAGDSSTYWTVSEQIGGTPGASNFLDAGGAPPRVPVTQLEEVWRYESSGQDLGTAWRSPGFNDAAWTSAALLERESISGLYNTGVNDSGTVLAPGLSDPHYVLTAAAQGTVGAQALVIQNHPNWLANDANSSWIGVVNPGANNIAVGSYNFRTTFNLANFIFSTVKLHINAAVDNELPTIRLNGNPTGLSHIGFDAFSPDLTVNSGFVSGQNTLEFLTLNVGTAVNPGGFRATLRGDGLVPNPAAPLPAGPVTVYFRLPFLSAGDPARTALTMNALVADGAVFYLNGVEVHRLNLPAGAVSAATLALADVPAPALTGPIDLDPASLVSGQNVLAVEVHRAGGSANAPILGVELFAATTPLPAIDLALNEIAGASDPAFFVELYNFGGDPLDLGGYVVRLDGADDHDYVLPAGALLNPGQYLALTEATLGFGAEEGDRILVLPAGRETVLDGAVVEARSQARSPAGTGDWRYPSGPTAGGPNAFAFQTDLVINEIMYHHRLVEAADGEPARESTETWIELYNKGTGPVDLTGWEIAGGISYRFTPGQTLAPGAYLVVAEDAALLRAKFPAATVVGNFTGRLSNNSDRLVLRDPAGNPADSVRYREGGRWPGAADGGGSSLELRDPAADNAAAEAWAASEESNDSVWQSYSYRAVATIPTGNGQPTVWNDFVLGLLADGECLVDDISVIEAPDQSPVEFISNGNFEGGAAGWRVIGTHGLSRVIEEPANPGNHALHLVATGAQEHMHNHIEATYLPGRSVVNGREYQISFRARWLSGNNLLNTRLYFNRAARSTPLLVPQLHGTPGTVNSRRLPNIGPTFDDLQHAPVIPQPAESVTVSVAAQDPQTVASVRLWWSVNGGAWNDAAMTQAGGNRWSGVIPPQSQGAIVQFYVAAQDGLAASAMFPADGPDSGALYAVADGQANLDLAHNVRILLTPAHTDLLHAFTNVMSNARLPGTVVYDERRAYYNVGVRLKGSERGRYSDTRTSYHLTFPPEDPFRGVHPVMLVDRSGAGDSALNKQQEILIKHILHRAGGIPGNYADLCRVIAPRSIHTGPAQLLPRHEDNFIETAYDNGGDGAMWELELIYYPTTANAAGYKNPNPDAVTGTDITDLGNDKEYYRYNFIIKKQRDFDNYDPFIALAKTWSLSGEALESRAPQVMDVDAWMRAWALVTLCGVGDSYTFGNNHNLLMYLRPSDRKFVPFPWDMDFSFNRGATSALVGDQNLSKVINRPANLRRFYAHILDIIDTSFNAAYIAPWADHYDNFAPGQSYASVPGYVGTRANFAVTQINSAAGNAPFAVSGGASQSSQLNHITLSGTAPVAVQSIAVNGALVPVTWTSLTAWALTVALQPGDNPIAIDGYSLHGEPLTNFTASVNVNFQGALPDPAGLVVFNEIMYHPAAPEASYVEIYNRSDSVSFDMSGWRINGLDYTFPNGSVLTNRQILVLAKDTLGYTSAYGLAVPPPFGAYDGVLQNDGETLTLFRPGALPDEEIVVDRVRYENAAPWPLAADGQGPSLQLIDPVQDNSRVGNWSDGQGWRLFTITGVIGTSSSIFLALEQPGFLHIDNVSIVEGTVPESGANLLANGGFETGALEPWLALRNHSNTVVTAEAAFDGEYSMKIIAEGLGSTVDLIRQNFTGLSPTATYTFSFRYLPSASNRLRWRLSSFLNDFNNGVNVTPVFTTPGRPNSSANPLPPFPDVWLNELQLDHSIGLADAQGEREPWIELFNAGSAPASLEGFFLSDNYSSLDSWAFPAGASLAPGEFKVVFLDGEPGESTPTEWHASFRPASGPGAIALSWSPNGSVSLLDYLNYPALADNRSYGDHPDGQPFNRLEFFFPTPGAPNNNAAPPLIVHINEWMASNTQSLLNTNGNNRFDDWFEIYNPGSLPANVGGYFLTDNLDNPLQFEIPDGYVVPPQGHLLVWADSSPELNLTDAAALHANFRLSQDGEAIGMFAADGSLIDAVVFPPQFSDISQGRVPDGGQVFYLANSTPAAPNSSWANRWPTLDLIPNIQAPVGQSVSFVVGASDPDDDVLTFSFDVPPHPGAALDPVTGLFTWTPTVAHLGTNSFIVRVADNGQPPLSAAAQFLVVVIEGFFVADAVVTAGGEIQFAIPTVSGKTYRVEYKNSLQDSGWTPLGPDRPGTGAVLIIADPIGVRDQRYYRVVELP